MLLTESLTNLLTRVQTSSNLTSSKPLTRGKIVLAVNALMPTFSSALDPALMMFLKIPQASILLNNALPSGRSSASEAGSAAAFLDLDLREASLAF